MRGKELAKGLSHATTRLGFAPHGGLGHLVDTFPLYRREELCNAPMGTQGMCPALALVWSCPRVFQGKSKAIRPKFSLFPCAFTERMGCVHATSTCPNDDDRRSSIGLCMIRDNHSIGIRNIGVSRLPLHPTRGPATRMLSRNNQPDVRSFSLGSTSNFADLADQIGTVY